MEDILFSPEGLRLEGNFRGRWSGYHLYFGPLMGPRYTWITKVGVKPPVEDIEVVVRGGVVQEYELLDEVTLDHDVIGYDCIDNPSPHPDEAGMQLKPMYVEALNQMMIAQRRWSNVVFGEEYCRGPVGAVKHIVKECQEVIDAVDQKLPLHEVHKELADIGLLWLDAVRRAGTNLPRMILLMSVKQKQCELRNWEQSSDGVFEHKRD